MASAKEQQALVEPPPEVVIVGPITGDVTAVIGDNPRVTVGVDPNLTDEGEELPRIVLEGELRDEDTDALITDGEGFITVDNESLRGESDNMGKFIIDNIRSRIPGKIVVQAQHPKYRTAKLDIKTDSEEVSVTIWMKVKSE
ncbi:MAG: hypothetical protein ISS70_16855 [Phycisphaerae bacterium]|nr:hypothetical protein [Phycisphaerae bacterium]